MSAFEATASHLGRLSSAGEQQALASMVSMVSPPPSQVQGLPGNLSSAMPSPGSLFLTPTGSLGGPSLWSPASLSLGADAQQSGREACRAGFLAFGPHVCIIRGECGVDCFIPARHASLACIASLQIYCLEWKDTIPIHSWWLILVAKKDTHEAG